MSASNSSLLSDRLCAYTIDNLICDKPVYKNVTVKIDVVFLVCNRKRKKRYSYDSDESQPGPSTPKKTSRPRGFCDDWLVKYDWLYLENGKMKCHPCVNTRQNNPFSAGSGCTNFRNSTLVRHQKTSAHTDALKGLKLQSDMKKSMKKAEHEQIQL